MYKFVSGRKWISIKLAFIDNKLFVLKCKIKNNKYPVYYHFDLPIWSFKNCTLYQNMPKTLYALIVLPYISSLLSKISTFVLGVEAAQVGSEGYLADWISREHMESGTEESELSKFISPALKSNILPKK